MAEKRKFRKSKKFKNNKVNIKIRMKRNKKVNRIKENNEQMT